MKGGPALLSVASRPIFPRATASLSLVPFAPVAHTITDAFTVAAYTGGFAIAVHLSCVKLIKKLPTAKRPAIISSSTGYAVYKFIGLAFVIAFVSIGGAWYLPAAAFSAKELLLAPDSTVRFLAAVVFGSLVLWDLPCAIFIKRLRAPDLIAHHVGMALSAYLVMAHLPLRYGLFFLGGGRHRI